MDEGLACEGKVLKLFNGERAACWVEIRCQGRAGHGSQLFDSTVGEKISTILHQINEFRKTQVEKLSKTDIGNITSINVTGLEAGRGSSKDGERQMNVIPSSGAIFLDIRIGSDVSFDAMLALLQQWCAGSSETTIRASKIRVLL